MFRLSVDIYMAVPMHPTTTPGTKIYQDRTVNGKVSSIGTSAQQSPSRPSSVAPNPKVDTEHAKTPLGLEDLNIPQTQGSSSNEAFRGLPGNVAISLEQFNALNQATRGHPSANP